MSDDPKMIPLMETNVTPVPLIRKKNRKKTGNTILKLILVALVILIILLIVALILSLLRKCNDIPQEKENKKIEKKEKERTKNYFWNNNYLPDFAKPNHYIITLQLLKEAYTLAEHNSSNVFYGNVIINFTMLNNINFLVLNTKLLSIKSVVIDSVNEDQRKKSIHIVKRIIDDVFDQTIFVFKETLQKSMNYSIGILYSGNITISESGIIRTFYRSFYNNRSYGILYSKLEPLGARRMFPCFDEPDKKALFTVKIIHFSKYTALSNMPIVSRIQIYKPHLIVQEENISNSQNLELSTFNSTVIYMSTYLVAFALLEDYQQLHKNRLGNKNVSIWVPKGLESSGTNSLKYSISTETFFEMFLNFSSPFPKTDHVYIPNFLSGAMENWGLITYRENHLLMPQRQSQYESKTAYITIAHELAHTWFGNWVTMKTWKDLWLNEGFATYFASYAYMKQSHLNDDKIKELYAYMNRKILEKDGKPKSYPVRLSVINFANIFNSFTYYKGEAMLVWLNNMMGDHNFRLGIQLYMKKYSQSNPTTKQFFTEMQIYDSKSMVRNFSEYFDPWLNKIGYPVLTVNYDILNQEVIISQESIVTNSSSDDLWPVYTTYKSDLTFVDNPILFQQKYFKIKLDVKSNGFLLLNSDASSYVRVNYSYYLWDRIIENIRNNNEKISPLNKIVLFDDNLFFADSDLINISITKRLIDTLVNETNYIPWSIFYNRIFTKIYNLFYFDKEFLKWTHYVKALSQISLKKAFEINVEGKLNVEEESFQRQMFLLNCEIDNQQVLDYLSKLFQTWIMLPYGKKLPKHLTTVILYYGIRENDKEEHWMKMWKMMIENDQSNPVDRDQIAIGLAGTSKTYFLNKLLNYVLTPGTHISHTSKQNFLNNLVQWILSSSNGFQVLSRWILNNSTNIKRYAFGDDVPTEAAHKYFNKLIEKISSIIYDVNFIQPLLSLHTKDNLIKTIMSNNRWKENVGKRLLQNI